MNGQIVSSSDPKNVWIQDDYKRIGGLPHQTRWVYDSDVSVDQYDAAPKTEKAGVVPVTEGFANPEWLEGRSQLLAGALFLTLAFGLVLTTRSN
jgi:hypothetical protein